MPWTDEIVTAGTVSLRAAVEGDRPALVSMLTSRAVRAFLGGPITDDALRHFTESPVGERWGSFVIESVDICIGSVGFGREHGEPEISYQLLPDYWGAGLAAAAVTAAIEWAWRATDWPSVIAVTQAANDRSIALLQRIGFVFEREFVEFDALQHQYRLERP